MFSYLVPLKRIKNTLTNEYQIVINESLIDNCIDYVRMQLLKLFQTPKN